MEIIESLRASHDAPIVVVSGDDSVEDEVRRRGAAAYILKPFDPFDELLPVIEQVTSAPRPPA
jgi:DNA-binding response OmpR family regulator